MLTRSSRPSVLCAIAALSLLFACDDAVVEPEPELGSGETEDATVSVDGPLAEVGRGLALALDDSALRQQVLMDMRDSPFPEHSLPLQGYLASDGGRDLAAAAARELGISADELRGRLEEQPDLQLYMPSTLQRGLWEGEGPVTVVAALLEDEDVASGELTAWSSEGPAVGVSPTDRLETPTLAVLPARHDFGSEPAAALRDVDGHDRKTVARKGALPVHRADGRPARDDVDAQRLPAASGGGGYAPGQAGLEEWMSWHNCRLTGSTNDLDADGLIDHCEEELARSFRPLLWFHSDEQIESRETYWAVRVQDFSQRKVFIFYALGYHDDKTHVGDSEFIQLRLVHEAGRWKLLWADYSAHFQAINDASATYSYLDLLYADRERGRPIAYVAEGKHGSYNTVSECGDGLLNLDDCLPGFAENVEAVAARNLGGMYGSTERLKDCVDSASGRAADGHGLSSRECFWTAPYFDGWHSGSDETEGYKDILNYFGWLADDRMVSVAPNPCPTDDRIIKMPQCS